MVQKVTDTKSLRNAIRALPELHPKHKWDEHRMALRKHILHEDPNNFINWSTVQATMFVGDNRYTRREYKEFKRLPKIGLFSDFQISIHENWIGNPPVFELNKETSGNMVHQAYHFYKFIDLLIFSDKNFTGTVESVAEIGGGYGTMCRVVNRSSKNQYYLFDHPEFLLLQEYYLYRSGIKNVHFHNRPEKIEVDILIAISSLSEMPVKLREDYLQHVQAKYYFISYQNVYFDVDNDTFFREYFADFNTLIIEPHPYIKTHNYLVAKR